MPKHLLTGTSFTRIALVDKGASFDPKTGDGAHVLLFKRADPADGDTMNIADILKALATLTAADKESLQKALGAAPAPEDILKNASPEIKALLQKQADDLKKANDEAAANKAAIADLQKANRTVELRKRVDIFKSLSGDKGVLADVLRTVEDSDKDLAKKFEEILTAHNAQLEKGGVVKPGLGSRGTTETAGGGTALDEVKKLAAEIVTKDAKVTEADAIARIFDENPDLYQRYHDETAGAGSADKK